VIVVSDTSMWAADVPSMCVGMRGLYEAQIDMTGPEVDLHSGSFGGGVPNPLQAMAALLAGLHDSGGRVTLPGFYDKVAPLPADVEAALREYVAAHTPPGIEATVTPTGPGVRPAFSPIDSPAVAAGRQAMERAFGREVLFTREGGSGPEADLTGILQAPLVFV